jgi:glycosyltransferase involved in cell wall biosynthesis
MASAGKRVLMLLENNPFSEDIRVKREARALAQAGYQVTVICPRPKQGKFYAEVAPNIRLYQYLAPPDKGGALNYLWEYGYSTFMIFVLSLRVWWGPGFDVIHAHNPPDTMFPIAAFYKLFSKRFVFDHHDLAPEMFFARFGEGSSRLVHGALVLCEKLTCWLADLVIATNESYKRMEMTRGGVPAERIAIVRNGPDERMIMVEPAPEIRQRAGTILGYVGIMGPQDGLDYLLRAVHELVYTLGRADSFCVIIGKGNALDELRAYAEQLRLTQHVWFTGWVSEENLLRYLSAADICLDPDPSNPFNDRCTMIKMMEYMALGKPIVAFDLPEHRVTAQEAAVYAKPNDELDFARHIAALMDDPARRQRMGQVGRTRIESKLAWSYQEQQLLAAYGRLTTETVPSVKPVSTDANRV